MKSLADQLLSHELAKGLVTTGDLRDAGLDPDEYSEGVTDYEELAAGHTEGEMFPTIKAILAIPDNDVQFNALRSCMSFANGQLLGALQALIREPNWRRDEERDAPYGLDPKYPKIQALERRANAAYEFFCQAAAAIIPIAYDPTKAVQTFADMLQRMTDSPKKPREFDPAVVQLLEAQKLPMEMIAKIRAKQAEKQTSDLKAAVPALLATYAQLPFRDRNGEVVQDEETEALIESAINTKMIPEAEKLKMRYIAFMKGEMSEIPTLMQFDALREALKAA